MKKIFGFVLLILFGGLAGVVLERTLVPYLAAREPFSKIPRLTVERVTVVEPKEEIIIDRAQALERAVEAVRPSLVRVERRDARGRVLDSASGVAVTGDGVIATEADIVGTSGSFAVLRNGDVLAAEYLRRDADGRFALFRVDQDLPVVSFAEAPELVLGKTLFVLRAVLDDAERLHVTLLPGTVLGLPQDGVPSTDIMFDATTVGAPVFTIEGKLVGVVGSGRSLVPAQDIRMLLEQR